MTNSNIINRNLPERSKMVFYFPKPEEGGGFFVVQLPFFENIIFSEEKRARFQTYSLVSRSSDLYTYLGAESRKFNLTFNLSLLHLIEEHPEINLDRFFYSTTNNNLEFEKKKFLTPDRKSVPQTNLAFILGTEYTTSLARESALNLLNSSWFLSGKIPNSEIEYFNEKYGINIPRRQQFSQNLELLNRSETPFQSVNYDFSKKSKIIDLIIYWVNIVRASVLNNADNPLYGPPIIRITNGILYQNIPCICTSYSIDKDESAGYEINTLLPNVIKISMRLEEIRSGDFTTYSNSPVKRDNLVGWESVLLKAPYSVDPGNEEVF